MSKYNNVYKHKDIWDDWCRSRGEDVWESSCSAPPSAPKSLEELEEMAAAAPEPGEEEHKNAHYEKLIDKQQPSRLEGSIKFPFVDIVHLTKEEHKKQGAVLLELLDKKTGEIVEKWVPKKLCRNLCAEGYTIYIWDEFVQNNLWEYL